MSKTRSALAATVALAFILALPALASAPRSGPLHLTKECSQYTGAAGSFCTVTSSNLGAIPVGSTIVYAEAFGAAGLDTDIVVFTRGANSAFGHVTLDAATGLGTVTLTGGSGQFKQFSATGSVSPLGGNNYAWHGTAGYSNGK